MLYFRYEKDLRKSPDALIEGEGRVEWQFTITRRPPQGERRRPGGRALTGKEAQAGARKGESWEQARLRIQRMG